MKTGSCLCGAVRYSVNGPLRPVKYCHCTQCRKTSGLYVGATAAADADLVIEGAESIAWYASSAEARRGFCSVCGSNLFWKREGSATTSIWAGSVDKPTGLVAERHIFVADKGDYYEINDGLAQYQHYDD